MRKPLSLALLVAVGTVIAVSSCALAAGEQPKDASKSAPVIGAGTDWLAQREAVDTKPKAAEEPSTPVTVVSFILKLALVLGLCYATMLGLKKFTSEKRGGASRGQIKVVENSTIGANRTLHLIEIGSKHLLVASTPSHINLLAELEPGDVAEPVPHEPRVGFKEQLALFIAGGGAGFQIPPQQGRIPPQQARQSANTVAQMIRDSSSHIQGRVREVANFRRFFRDAESR